MGESEKREENTALYCGLDNKHRQTSKEVWFGGVLLPEMPGFLNFLLLLGFLNLTLVCNGEGDGRALVQIKNHFNDVGNALYDWGTSSDYCSWKGVICDNTTFNVVSLKLSGLNLDGDISPAIGDLKGLKSIDLNKNRLSGKIPDEIGGCSLLKTLDLSFNNIHGYIPESISKLKQLENLYLKNNMLNGPIPPTLSQIPNLSFLDLAHNNLSGEIPKNLYSNRVLQYLGLRANNLEGALSPEMCQLTGAWFFDVSNNSLTGTIPSDIGNCTRFQVLDLSHNQLIGDIPENIGFLQVATLSLQGNKFRGSIPSVIGLMQAITVLDLSCNLLTGPIPSILGNLTYTEKLYLHGNNLNGSIPPEIGDMISLNYLKLSDNKLTGHIPSELGNLVNLFHLNVANNYLEGPIPATLSSCVNLNSLNAYGNKLNGSISHAFDSIESMTYLNLSSNNLNGHIPVELSKIGNLDTLDISTNKFTGSIPSSIGDLEHLLTLNLSNNFLVGHIPAEFGNLRSILEIDLSDNHLSGSIPKELGLLQNLISIKAENNSLIGDVFPLINCLSLAFLNLSYNRLTGEIPNTSNFTRFSPDSFIGNPSLCGDWLPTSCDRSHPPGKGSILKRGLIIFMAITIVGFLILTVMLFMILKPHKVARHVDKSPDQHLIGYASPKLVILHMNMSLHMYEDIMRMTENLSEKYIIGHGASSTVYKCTLKNCKPVAIKKLHSQFPNSLEEFQTELDTVGSIKHRNLVSLHAYSLSSSGNLLFYDYMENGSLWDILHGSSKERRLNWDDRMRIALGTAQGLAYLHHECSPRIIHRDVKSSNILLDRDYEAHLTDFGIAKSLSGSRIDTSTYIMGTIGYIDPEYARTFRVNEKSDVYSYGIVFLELLTGRKAVDNESNLQQWIMAKASKNAVMETVDPEILETCKDLGIVKKAFQLALLCTKKQPHNRPTMHVVTRVLHCLAAHPIELAEQAKTQIPTNNYLDEYGCGTFNTTSASSLSTSDVQLFLKFSQIMSKNSE